MPSQVVANRLILDELLSEFAGRLDGVIDFVTIACVGQFPPHPQDFVKKYVGELGDVIAMIRTRLDQEIQDQDEVSKELIVKLYESQHDLEKAFLVLAHFRSETLDGVREATRTVIGCHSDIRDAIESLGRLLSIPVSYYQSRTAEKEAYYQSILSDLFSHFAHEWQAKPEASSPAQV